MSRVYDYCAAKASVEHLKRLSTVNSGMVPTWALAAAATKLDVSERTIWNWLSAGVPNPPALKFDRAMERRLLSALAAAHGSYKRAWRVLQENGDYHQSYVQFSRDIKKLSPVMLTAATKGFKEAFQKGLYLQGTSTGRLDRVLFDHTMIDLRVQREYGGKLEMFRPWITFLLDSHTRVILSCIITEGDGVKGDPGTETLVALLAAAIHGTVAPDETFIGGVPAVIQYDNAKAHLANAMLHGYLELGIAGHAIRPGSPWEDGRVEALMDTFNQELLAMHPGYTKAIKDRYDHEPWIPSDCLTIEEFKAHLEHWIDSYNFERHHTSLDATPFEAWKNDPTPINRVDDDLIRKSFLDESRGRRVSKSGIRFKNIDYTHELLGKLVGKRVTVKFLPNDRTFLDIYLDGQFVCSAIPHARLSKDQRTLIVRQRNQQIQNVDRIVKQSRRRAQRREREGNPLAGPERDPSQPLRTVEDLSDEDFLDFLERSVTSSKEDSDVNDN